MEPYFLVGILTLFCPLFNPCTCLLDIVGDADLEAVRYRLQDEKEKRLLLENDVETMMLKLAELERLCKKDRNKTEVTSSSQCTFGFVSRANHCYLYVQLEATWIEAQMYCRVFGGSLVSIETPEEWTIFRSYLASIKGNDHIWIDSNDILNEGIWHWTKGNGDQRMIGKARLGIWLSDQPDNHDSGEHCGTLKKVSGQYFGNDDFCSNKRHFICETQ